LTEKRIFHLHFGAKNKGGFFIVFFSASPHRGRRKSVLNGKIFLKFFNFSWFLQMQGVLIEAPVRFTGDEKYMRRSGLTP